MPATAGIQNYADDGIPTFAKMTDKDSFRLSLKFLSQASSDVPDWSSGTAMMMPVFGWIPAAAALFNNAHKICALNLPNRDGNGPGGTDKTLMIDSDHLFC